MPAAGVLTILDSNRRRCAHDHFLLSDLSYVSSHELVSKEQQFLAHDGDAVGLTVHGDGTSGLALDARVHAGSQLQGRAVPLADFDERNAGTGAEGKGVAPATDRR